MPAVISKQLFAFIGRDGKHYAVDAIKPQYKRVLPHKGFLVVELDPKGGPDQLVADNDGWLLSEKRPCVPDDMKDGVCTNCGAKSYSAFKDRYGNP